MVVCALAEQFGIGCEWAKSEKLRGEPLALLDPNGRVQVASTDAAAKGVAVGQVASAAKLLCPTLVTRPYDHATYLEAAECLWNAYAAETSFVEPVSPEVCYFELSGKDQEARTRTLHAAVSASVGLPVKMGMAHARFIAEVAARASDGVRPELVGPGQEAAATAECDLTDVADLDRKTLERFGKLGIRTLGDLYLLGVKRLPKGLQAAGTKMERRGLGLDSPPIQPLWPPRSERVQIGFDDEVGDLLRIETALRAAAGEIAGRLSGGFAYARQITLTALFGDGGYQVEVEQAAVPLAGVDLLSRAALRLLKRMGLTQPVVGVVVEARQIAEARSVQLSLLDSNPGSGFLPHERDTRRSVAVRYLRGKFGLGAVLPLDQLYTARRIGLWADALGHVLDEPVVVVTGPDQRPISVRRRLAWSRVLTVQDHWEEAAWFLGDLTTHEVFRVGTEAGDLWELHRVGEQWRLVGLAD